MNHRRSEQGQTLSIIPATRCNRNYPYFSPPHHNIPFFFTQLELYCVKMFRSSGNKNARKFRTKRTDDESAESVDDGKSLDETQSKLTESSTKETESSDLPDLVSEESSANDILKSKRKSREHKKSSTSTEASQNNAIKEPKKPSLLSFGDEEQEVRTIMIIGTNDYD